MTDVNRDLVKQIEDIQYARSDSTDPQTRLKSCAAAKTVTSVRR